MYTKNDLINDLKNMGIDPTDTVFVHSSYKHIAGEMGVEGGADTVVDAFIEYFGKEGLAVFPAMSWKLGYWLNDDGDICPPWEEPGEGFKPYGNEFDVKTTPCHGLGIIPEIFRQRENVVRSLCPTSSVCAYGKDAKSFCADHEKAETPLNWNSPWGKLYDRKAKILFLGTTMSCNTFMHVLEEKAEVPGILAPYIWKYTATGYDGKVHKIEFKRHEPHHNAYYHKMEPEFLENGIVKMYKFGAADTHLADAVAETDYMMKTSHDDPERLLEILVIRLAQEARHV